MKFINDHANNVSIFVTDKRLKPIVQYIYDSYFDPPYFTFIYKSISEASKHTGYRKEYIWKCIATNFELKVYDHNGNIHYKMKFEYANKK